MTTIYMFIYRHRILLLYRYLPPWISIIINFLSVESDTFVLRLNLNLVVSWPILFVIGPRALTHLLSIYQLAIVQYWAHISISSWVLLFPDIQTDFNLSVIERLLERAYASGSIDFIIPVCTSSMAQVH